MSAAALLDTEYGEVQCRTYYEEVLLRIGTTELGLCLPDPDDPNQLESGATCNLRGYRRDWTEEKLDETARLLAFGYQLVGLLNQELANQIDDARERKAEAERIAGLALRALEMVWAERSEKLLTEFLEEKGRIRLRGMKRWRPVTVQARELGEGEYVPEFIYQYEKHGYSESFRRSIQAFQVKVGSRYKNVWNDGDSDLHEWDRSEKTAGDTAAYDGSLN